MNNNDYDDELRWYKGCRRDKYFYNVELGKQNITILMLYYLLIISIKKI